MPVCRSASASPTVVGHLAVVREDGRTAPETDALVPAHGLRQAASSMSIRTWRWCSLQVRDSPQPDLRDQPRLDPGKPSGNAPRSQPRRILRPDALAGAVRILRATLGQRCRAGAEREVIAGVYEGLGT